SRAFRRRTVPPPPPRPDRRRARPPLHAAARPGPLEVAFRGAMGASERSKWLILAVVGAAFFMTILDVAIVNVAIPSIQKDLKIAESTVQWVVTAYAITFGGFLLLGGRMADLLGRRRIFVVGLVLFTVASLLCGLASSAGVLIGARALQG